MLWQRSSNSVVVYGCFEIVQQPPDPEDGWMDGWIEGGKA